MAIERAIYASLPLGIEKSESGFQFYSYTPGFKALLEADTTGTLLGLATAGYKEPDAGEWLLDLPADKNISELNQADYRPYIPGSTAECNLSEAKAKRFHPYSFSYKPLNTENGPKPMFAFGKNMGFDWTGRRPGNAYNYILTCEKSDVKKAPVSYCSSPAVCCNIPRSEFFPETGALSQPALLSCITSLDTTANIAPLKYTAGFDEITPNDIVEFLSEEDRIEIFLSMITSLMEYKEGNVRRRIIIADTKVNTMLWIAAISYIFPVENLFDLSFTSYTYAPSDYDINGVFDPVLNDCFRDSRSGYSYDIACNAYSVYDFRQCIYAPEVTVADNLFNDAVNNAFTMNLRIIDNYKDYILKNTSYRGLDSGYADGYNLFAYMTGKNIKYSLPTAIEFAKKYASASEKKNLLRKLMNESTVVTKTDENLKALRDYIDYCCSNGIEKSDAIRSFFVNSVNNAVFDENTDSALFLQKKNICLTLCSISDTQLAAIIVTNNDKSKFLDLVETTKDGWRISYIVHAICCTAEKAKCSIQCRTSENKIIALSFMKLFESDTINDTVNLEKYIQQNFKILVSVTNKVHFLDAAYIALEDKNYRNCTGVISQMLSDMYMNGNSAEKKEIFNAIAKDDTSVFYVDKIIQDISNEQNSYKLISAFQDLVDTGGNIINDYIDNIASIVARSQSNTTSMKPDERMNVCYATYSFLKSCSAISGLSIKTEDMQKIYNDYLQALLKSAPDYIISNKNKKELLELDGTLSVLGGKTQKVLTDILVSLTVMNDNITNTDSSSCFNGRISYNLVDIAPLIPNVQDIYITSVGTLCGKYWVENDSFPMYEQMVAVSGANKCSHYEILFGHIIEYVLKNTAHGTSRRAADIVEIAIIKGYTNLLDNIPLLLAECKVKKNILDYLDKDIKNKVELKKKAEKDTLLNKIDVIELQKRTEQIREYYNENSKSVFGNIMGLFGKKK